MVQPSPLGEVLSPHAREAGAPKAITAAAHKLARIVCHLLATREPYDERVYQSRRKISAAYRKTIAGKGPIARLYPRAYSKRSRLDGSLGVEPYLSLRPLVVYFEKQFFAMASRKNCLTIAALSDMLDIRDLRFSLQEPSPTYTPDSSRTFQTSPTRRSS